MGMAQQKNVMPCDPFCQKLELKRVKNITYFWNQTQILERFELL